MYASDDVNLMTKHARRDLRMMQARQILWPFLNGLRCAFFIVFNVSEHLTNKIVLFSTYYNMPSFTRVRGFIKAGRKSPLAKRIYTVASLRKLIHLYVGLYMWYCGREHTARARPQVERTISAGHPRSREKRQNGDQSVNVNKQKERQKDHWTALKFEGEFHL